MWKLILLIENARKYIQLFTLNFYQYDVILPQLCEYIYCLFN